MRKFSNQNNILTICWKIKTINQLYCYTTHYQDIKINQELYLSGKIIHSSSLERSNDLNNDNYEFSTYFEDNDFSNEALLKGLFDNAYVECFIIDPQNLSARKLFINCGYIKQIKLIDKKIIFEIRGLTSQLDIDIVKIYSPTCRAKFGDQYCKVNPKSFAEKTSIIKVINDQALLIKPVNILNENLIGAEVTFLSGKNIGDKNTIIYFENNLLQFKNNLNNLIYPEDIIEIIPNCSKAFNICSSIYNNGVNFRGEPDIPGIDEMLKTAGTYK